MQDQTSQPDDTPPSHRDRQAAQHGLEERIDLYPFQHRLAEVMTVPSTGLNPDDPISTAIAQLAEQKTSCLIALDRLHRPIGILTEHDVIKALAAHGAGGLSMRVGDLMTAPVAAMPPDAFLFAAIARMHRLGIRHLAVTDPIDGKLLGLLRLATLLRQRAEEALMVQGDIAAAQSVQDLQMAQARLPKLAATLRREYLRPEQIAGVISTTICETTKRAAELALLEMAATGQGPAPARWSLLILGSAGRGESLLAADQDNALIHDGDTDDLPWFAEFGKRIADILDAAGIPYCRGGVMAANRDLRHNVRGWRRMISAWLEAATPEALLNADIFYDFKPVAGDIGLAASLRAEATTSARGHRVFHALLARGIGQKGSALTLLGNFRTRAGRADLKGRGLQPLVSGARVLALELGVTSTSTLARWRAAHAAQLVSESDLVRIEDAFGLILDLVLEQQLDDIEHGLAPSANVDTGRLHMIEKQHLKQALQMVDQIDLIVRNSLGLV
jgi:signal-transduction protein with cAMP-binding, CBS, and nucleotidyltransferase domain